MTTAASREEQPILCPACGSVWVQFVDGTPQAPQGSEFACPGCQQPVLLEFGPAIYRNTRRNHGAVAATEGESSCFFHAEKRADHVCDECGRFLCGLCHMPVGDRTLCPGCITAAVEGEKSATMGGGLVNRCVRWDFLASQIFSLGMVFGCGFVLGVFFGSAVIFFAVKGLRSQCSLVSPPKRWRLWLLVVLGALQFLACVAYYLLIFGVLTKAPWMSSPLRGMDN